MPLMCIVQFNVNAVDALCAVDFTKRPQWDYTVQY